MEGILGAGSEFDIATDQSKFVFKLKLINLIESPGQGDKALSKKKCKLLSAIYFCNHGVDYPVDRAFTLVQCAKLSEFK
ncbi:hypothetical protein D6I95_08915 [Alcaligenes faecalis]|nr:hypothetical protein D6I95_08915 [Alcaligenes faecalis]